MKSTKWIKIFFGLSLIGVLFITSINFIFDPQEINLNKVKKYNFVIDKNLERKLKLYLYKNNEDKIENLIFGSSRVTVIESNLLGKNSFNFGFSAARLEEILYLIKNEINIRNTKAIYIGLDEFMFDYSEEIFGEGVDFFYNQKKFYSFNYYFSISTLKDVIKNLFMFNNKLYEYTKDGDKIILQFNVPTLESIDKYLEDRLIEIKKGFYRFDISKIELLNEIILFTKSKNIELYLFINPLSKELRDFYIKNNSEYEEFIKYIRIRYYNFNYDNEITQNIYKYYSDAHHYNKEVGKMIINFINNNYVQNNFGKINE